MGVRRKFLDLLKCCNRGKLLKVEVGELDSLSRIIGERLNSEKEDLFIAEK